MQATEIPVEGLRSFAWIILTPLWMKKSRRLRFLMRSQTSRFPRPTLFDMFFRSLLAATTVAFFAAQAAGAPSFITSDEVKAVSSNNEARAALIAPDAINACNCPNNCRHKFGSSCKFYREGNVITAS